MSQIHPRENTTRAPLPPQLLVGSDRTITVLWYTYLCTVSLILQFIFFIGTRKLCGWDSNFCFILLRILSLMCMIRFTTEFIASLTALFYMDWVDYQFLWIGIGSLAIAPYYTVVVLYFAITFHRLIYTAFPFSAYDYLNKSIMKIAIAAIFLFFFTFVIVLNTDLLGVRWVDSYMTFAIMKSRNIEVFRWINTLSHYALGVVNPVAHAVLFVLLTQRKIISFRRNHEIKMTVQVLCMVICGCLFFIYWEFVAVHGFGAWDFVIAETSNLLFFHSLVLPYLILNEFVENFMLFVFIPQKCCC